MHSEPLLAKLQEMTGRALFPDERNPFGAHLEYITPGYLALHEDFSHVSSGANPQHEDRVVRLNVLLFLERVQGETGYLELWASEPAWQLPTHPLVRVAPQRNRLVLWDTTRSVHGMPWPLQGQQPRRALQWYYAEASVPTDLGTDVHVMPCNSQD